MRASAMDRVILHLDMDAFYAAVETRDDPSLAGRPLIVGHRGRRGVVSTCSYAARAFGVRSAMASLTAERLCPQARWLPVRMSRYVEVSREIGRILDDFSPAVEPLSIDEAFLDLTGIARDLADGREAAARLKARLRAELRLTGSVGVAPNKFLAKVASDLEKPDGLVVLGWDDVEPRLWPLPVRRLWGVGPRTGERLEAAGIRTVGDVLRVEAGRLEQLVGAGSAEHLRALARGADDRPVEPTHRARSLSEERTYDADLTRPEDVDRALLARAEGVARQLRREGLVARTLQLKVRGGDYTTWTRAKTLPAPTDLAEPLVRAARELLRDRVDLGGRGVRLLGLGASGLEERGRGQAALFDDPIERRARKLAAAADAVRDRLGERALVRARLLTGSVPGLTRREKADGPPRGGVKMGGGIRAGDDDDDGP